MYIYRHVIMTYQIVTSNYNAYITQHNTVSIYYTPSDKAKHTSHTDLEINDHVLDIWESPGQYLLSCSDQGAQVEY